MDEIVKLYESGDYDGFLREIWESYETEMRGRDPADYEINREQMGKLIEAYRIFSEIAESCNGTIEPFQIEPVKESGYITLHCTVYYLSGGEIQKLCTALRNVSALSIDAQIDGTVDMSMVIPKVFQKKKGL